MWKHVNVEREIDVIVKKFEESLFMFDDPDGLIFFNIIDFLGCHISALFKHHFSATDCCNTVETIENIFQINKYTKEIKIHSGNELTSLFNLKSNYVFKFRVLPEGLTFHTFIVIKYNDNLFILQSFAGICRLNVVEDKNIPMFISDFVDDPSARRFNHLFKTDIPEPNTETNNANMTLLYIKYNELPTNYLLQLLEEFKIKHKK